MAACVLCQKRPGTVGPDNSLCDACKDIADQLYQGKSLTSLGTALSIQCYIVRELATIPDAQRMDTLTRVTAFIKELSEPNVRDAK